MAEKDRISELPVGILDHILGFLPIQEAARTAILSSFWRDIWFSLTKLDFDYGFFEYICLKYSNAKGGKSESPIFKVINKIVFNILMRHNGPIHKVVFNFSEEVFAIPRSKEFGFEDIFNLVNQWFLLLTQNGVQEIEIYCAIDINARCRVPNCIFSCPTLKSLEHYNVIVELINPYCVLPNVTSLYLSLVEFEPRTYSDYVVHLPMFEDFSFQHCENIYYFNIVAPKLGSLKIILDKLCSGYDCKQFLPHNLDLRSISSLNLDCSACCFEVFVKELNRVVQPFALNLERLMLLISIDSLSPDSAFIHLLRASPKLCELDICGLQLNPEDFVLMEELSSVAQTLKMLHTLKFSYFDGLRSEMQSTIRVFLACFSGIKKVVIVRGSRRSAKEEFKIVQELLRFSRASTKAEIYYI